jgi:mono/diheme cytochrome c family protein
MRTTIRLVVVAAMALFVACAASSAQSAGEATYKAKCQMCHGATGQADTPMGKATKTLPVSDPEVKKHTAAEMFDATKGGKGKMQPFKDKLTDEQIKDAVAYYRTLK